jgi:hypothetical protein
MYPWEFAPDWAKFAATDRDGQKFWYESRPFYNLDHGRFFPSSGRVAPVPVEMSSLRSRP